VKTTSEHDRAKDFTQQRNEAVLEGVKGLFLMNGGGAVAMLAFLQVAVVHRPLVIPYVLSSVVCFSVGIALAALIPFFRYHSSYNFQKAAARSKDDANYKRHRQFRSLWVAFSYLSVTAFVIGAMILAIGGLCHL
jgi:hypothetical protein